VRQLFPKRLVAVCQPELLATVGAPLAAGALLDLPLIHNTSMQGGWRDWFASARVICDNVPAAVEVPSSALVLEAVVAGGVVGLVDRAFIDDDLADGRIVLASDHELSDDEGYYLTWPDGAASPPSLEYFAEWLFAELQAPLQPIQFVMARLIKE
jgi:DNA-binding transcriptional LysR family regulator